MDTEPTNNNNMMGHFKVKNPNANRPTPSKYFSLDNQHRVGWEEDKKEVDKKETNEKMKIPFLLN